MKIKSELISILHSAIEVCAPDIHFTLAETGIIVIQLRSENIMIPHSYLLPEQYKQLLEYIETNAVLETYPQEYPKFGVKDGIMKIFEPSIILVCHISILEIKHNKFKSLCLHIKNPPIPACQKLKKLAEIKASMILD